MRIGNDGSSRAQRQAQMALAFSCIGHFYSHFFPILFFTVALGLTAEFDESYAAVMALAIAGKVLYGAAALPAGWLGDRWSTLGMMVIYFVGIGLGAVATGLAPSPLLVAGGLALIGLFGAIYHPVGIAWMVGNAENRGQALGINGIFGSLGMAAGPLVAGVLMDSFGWRAAYIIPGVIAMATGLALAAVWAVGHVKETRLDRKPTPDPAPGDVRRAFIVMSVTMLLGGFLYQSIEAVAPKLFELRAADLFGEGHSSIGAAVSLVYLFGAASNLLGGWAADRYRLKWVYLAFWILQAPLTLFAMNAVGAPLVVTIALVVTLQVAALPAENMLLARYTPRPWRATAFGAKFVLSFGVAALVLPFVGYIYESTGDFAFLFMTLTLMAVVIFVAGAMLPRDDGKSATAVAPPAPLPPAAPAPIPVAIPAAAGVGDD